MVALVLGHNFRSTIRFAKSSVLVRSRVLFVNLSHLETFNFPTVFPNRDYALVLVNMKRGPTRHSVQNDGVLETSKELLAQEHKLDIL
jgi:hypothetical protein